MSEPESFTSRSVRWSAAQPSSIDVEGRHEFWQVMRGLAGEGKTVVFATHYLEEADAFADRIVLVRRRSRATAREPRRRSPEGAIVGISYARVLAAGKVVAGAAVSIALVTRCRAGRYRPSAGAWTRRHDDPTRA
jgi:ABC-type cobalamin/Fe3+-siderophores transport system ATPase subunit